MGIRLPKWISKITQKAIPYDEYGEPLRSILMAFGVDVDDLFTQLVANTITFDDWEKAMQKLLARYNLSAYMTGAGTTALAQADTNGVIQYLKGQFSYLANFRKDMEKAKALWKSVKPSERKPSPLERFRWRATMYSQSPTAQYWSGKTRVLPLPAMPGEGSQCLTRCKCKWDIKTIDEKNGDWDCYWRLGVAEHCQTCIERAKRWNPIRVRGNRLIIPQQRYLSDPLLEELDDEGYTGVHLEQTPEGLKALKHLPGGHRQDSHGNRGKPDYSKMTRDDYRKEVYSKPFTLYRGQSSSNKVDGRDFSITDEGIVSESAQSGGYIAKLTINPANPTFNLAQKQSLEIWDILGERRDVLGWYNLNAEQLIEFYGAELEITPYTEALKHLPGQHDQLSHGNRGGAVVGTEGGVAAIESHLQFLRKYKGPIPKLLEEHGQWYEPTELPAGMEMQEPKRCFGNSLWLAQSNKDLTYVEGYAVPDFIELPMEHAWCVDKKGRVVDVTWENGGQAYFGIAYNTEYALEVALKTEVTGILVSENFEAIKNIIENGLPDGALGSLPITEKYLSDEKVAQKHLPGGHRQLSHGNRGGDISNLEDALLGAETLNWAKRMMVPPRDGARELASIHELRNETSSRAGFFTPTGRIFVMHGLLANHTEWAKNAFRSLKMDSYGALWKLLDKGFIRFSFLPDHQELNIMVRGNLTKPTKEMLQDFMVANPDMKFGLEINSFSQSQATADDAAKRLGIRLKHLPGRHNQDSHGNRGGDAGKQPAPKGTPKKSGFDREHWGAMDVPTRKGEWGELPQSERDRIADAGNSIKSFQEERLSFAGERPATGQVKQDIDERMNQIGDFLHEDSAAKIKDTVSEMDDILKEAGVSGELRHQLAMDAVDSLAVQDNESFARQLGDHGINHISGNIHASLAIAQQHPGEDTVEQAAQIYLAHIFHDTGYTTEPSRGFLDEGHPRWSMEHYDANLRETVSDALGERVAGNVSHLIRTHSSSDIDWDNDTLGTAVRVADNVALFQKEKLPALFRHVPGNIEVLTELGEKKISVEQAQKRMRANNAKAKVSGKIRKQLDSAVGEVSAITPKFTIGMLGGLLNGFSWQDGHLIISMKRDKSSDAIQKLLDLGQRQFAKFAETYGIPKGMLQDDLEFEFKDKEGKTLLETVVEELKEWLRYKHLPGQHAQLSHGNRGIAVGSRVVYNDARNLTGTVRKLSGRNVKRATIKWDKESPRVPGSKASVELLDTLTVVGEPENQPEKLPEKPHVDSGDVLRRVDTVDQLPIDADTMGRAYFVMQDDGLVNVTGNGKESILFHLGFVTSTDAIRNEFNITEEDADALAEEILSSEKPVVYDRIMGQILSQGIVRVREDIGSTNIQTQSVDTATLRRLQKLYDKDKLRFAIGKKHYWGGADSRQNVTFTYEDFLDAKHVVVDGGGKITLKEYTEKHLPGGHRQDTHGNRGGFGHEATAAGLHQAIRKAKPNYTDEEVQLVADVMKLRPDRFEHYNEKLGIGLDDEFRDGLFESEAAADRQRARERWDNEKELAFGGTVIQSTSEDWQARAAVLRGENYQEAIGILDGLGIPATVDPEADPQDAHYNLSMLANLVEQHPVVSAVVPLLRESGALKGVNINSKNKSGNNAAAQVHGDRIFTYGLFGGGDGMEKVAPGVWLHELGHIVDNHLVRSGKNGSFDAGVFGKGKFASMYKQMMPDEDFAEWFVALVGGSNALAELKMWDPSKYEYFKENVPGMDEWMEANE
jgi:hypothetical protein